MYDEGMTLAVTNPSIAKSLFNTPPDDTQDDQRPCKPMVTPNTLKGTVQEALTDEPTPPQKGKKQRAQKTDYSKPPNAGSQRSVQKSQKLVEKDIEDSPGVSPGVHYPGHRILHTSSYIRMLYDVRYLHDDIPRKEKSAKISFTTPNENRPVYTVMVPRGVGFLVDFPADIFYIDFRDIFNLLHLYSIEGSSLLRLRALHLSRKARAKNLSVVVADPYHIHEDNLKDREGVKVMTNYLAEFLVENKETNYLLVLYQMV